MHVSRNITYNSNGEKKKEVLVTREGNFFHQASSRLLGLCIVTINVQNLRHCHCKVRCTGSQPELRTTACTIDPKRSPQYQQHIDIRVSFHG
jgi:hypothetical protein